MNPFIVHILGLLLCCDCTSACFAEKPWGVGSVAQRVRGQAALSDSDSVGFFPSDCSFRVMFPKPLFWLVACIPATSWLEVLQSGGWQRGHHSQWVSEAAALRVALSRSLSALGSLEGHWVLSSGAVTVFPWAALASPVFLKQTPQLLHCWSYSSLGDQEWWAWREAAQWRSVLLWKFLSSCKSEAGWYWKKPLN